MTGDEMRVPWRALPKLLFHFVGLPRGRRLALMRFGWDLVCIDRKLKRGGFTAAYDALHGRRHPLTDRLRASTPADLAELVTAASRWTLGLRTTCLRRALLLCWLLRSRGVPCDLISGIGRKDHAWVGHAWVEIDGVPLGEVVDRRQYAAFTAQLSRPDPAAGTPSANSPIDPSRK